MNKYELALIVNAKLEDEERTIVVEKIKGYITCYNGIIEKVEEWDKKRLAYAIQHQREGFYYFIQFAADTVCPEEVEKHVRIIDSVLRYLIIRKDVK
ncbi:MAG: 30S ribosomal protein S6 [Lachnospiraceae bacterium]|nr:30S ribosomal protein S6 [Lachnospiraceae bacterium]